VAFLENGAALLTTNPMSPAWVDRVKACLGERFRPCLPVWCSRNVELDDNHRLVGERLMGTSEVAIAFRRHPRPGHTLTNLGGRLANLVLLGAAWASLGAGHGVARYQARRPGAATGWGARLPSGPCVPAGPSAIRTRGSARGSSSS
jgi:hypothetical protein